MLPMPKPQASSVTSVSPEPSCYEGMVGALRVVQWTTGKTGSAAVRGIVGHPMLDLVGCYAYSPEKVGQDIGVLAGLNPIGVAATDDIDALLALRPDCVSYMA